ncbi:MAG TPA: DUF4185 domain-containing protein [Acidimicrobiia bacterium]|nr:DUF4185 domain-containing protein [Acidimicrobiia bacterium]
MSNWRFVVPAGLALTATGVIVYLFLGRTQAVPLGILRDDPPTASRPAALPPLWEHFGSLSVTQQITGPGSPNKTFERWNVGGTDLGFTFYHKGDLYIVFGDTYGRKKSDWRSNTMAKLAQVESPASGLEIEHFISDPTGRASELLSSRKVYWVERTVIPTNGISVDDRMILHYMSVRRWVAPGQWRINHAGLAYSDDDAKTWVKTGPMWGAESNFAQVSFVRDPEDAEMVYMFGIPSGRFGEVRLARVPQASILQRPAYEYWNGADWTPVETQAARVVPPPVGELSVAWNEHLGLWVMMYLDERLKAILVRTATDLTGPWSEPSLITSAHDHPQLYAPFIIPFETNQPDIFFTMSRWDVYNVYLMHLTLVDTT